MKSYKDYEKRFIGSSDIASLVLVGCDADGLKSEFLNFGEDGEYRAYIVGSYTEIPEHYKHVYTFECWLKIYDDEELTYSERAKEFNIYRAGEFGCIIQVIN